MKILIITRTNWNEPPRIRHQLCNMLLKRGHKVVFLEKPTNKLLSPLRLQTVSENLTLGVYPELLHHQLKFFGLFQYLNAKFVMVKLKSFLNKNKFDLIFNFNYDYSYITSCIDADKFVTIINDDFIAQAKPWMRRAIREQMVMTCKVSSSVLSVSYPLKKLVDSYCDNSFLFLPWCDDKYEQPTKSKVRNVVLYYGFINNRLDWQIVKGLLDKDITIRFVGPINEEDAKNQVNSLSNNYDNFEYISPRCLSKLDLEDVCCSIAPYDISIESIKACTVSNRAFRLLAKGIPVIYPNLPHILEAPVEAISTASKLSEYIENITFYKCNFYNCQPIIKDFLPAHYSSARYQQLMNVVSSIV
ncbi:hypothetical protein [Kangiella sp.]|uniref:hypothetical protein n=1 Tax=Kangiella sp. TaxID=1920245 RepID=UPI003A8E1BF8